MSQPTKHIVALSLFGWGHLRPLITLCARIVKLRPDVHVTFLTTDMMLDRVQKEMARSFDEGEEKAAQCVRLLSIGNIPPMTPDVEGLFGKMWKTLTDGEGPVCAQSGTRHSVLPKPVSLIVDFFNVRESAAAKSISGDSVKIYSWVPGMMLAILYLFGPEKYGGMGNIHVKVEEESRRTGRTYDEVAMELCAGEQGSVLSLPAMPPMYDYENSPQDFSIPPIFYTQLFPRVYESLEKLDGLISMSFESYEPEAIAATKAWMAEIGRLAYFAGPLLPNASKKTAAANELQQSTEAEQIQNFLNETLKSSGENSLLYISFGSGFWPVKSPEKLWAFIEVVMELNIPFILSHASPFAGPVPDEIKEKVAAYGKGVLSPWTPQQLILDHPATGWFVTHGGQGGLTEAVAAGVPMVLWPFNADQPLNTIVLTEKHGVGYELLEVRTGNGLRPIRRTGYTPVGTLDAVKREARDILGKAFGEDGKEKRAKLRLLRKMMLDEWEEGGSSRRDVLAFLDTL